MVNIILVNGEECSDPTFNCLGHEIHITRIILLDLLCKNIISDNDIVVTCSDRIFLYDKIFHNTITTQQYNKLDKDKYNIIDIRIYLDTRTFYTIPKLAEMNYNYEASEYLTPEFIRKCRQINFYSIDEIKNLHNLTFVDNEKYIVIHHRYVHRGTNVEVCNIEHLKYILNSISKINNKYKIIVFSRNINNLRNELTEYNSLYFINDLRLYASIMALPNCELVIGEWSGGTQLSQYCTNNQVLYFFDTYSVTRSYMNILNLLRYESTKKICNAWDFRSCTDCKVYMYHDSIDLANNLHKHIS